MTVFKYHFLTYLVCKRSYLEYDESYADFILSMPFSKELVCKNNCTLG